MKDSSSRSQPYADAQDALAKSYRAEVDKVNRATYSAMLNNGPKGQDGQLRDEPNSILEAAMAVRGGAK